MREHLRLVTTPRKLIIAWVASFLVMMILTGAAIQWANYIDRRSNQRWCNLVTLFNDAYKTDPPPSDLGKKIAAEMLILQKDFKCKTE